MIPGVPPGHKRLRGVQKNVTPVAKGTCNDYGWRETFFPGEVMTVHQCPTCGKHLDGNVRFCPEDGTPLTETAAASGLRTPHTSSATQRALLTLPTVIGNRYKLIEARGGGGMAKVYRATDQTLEREVAVKLINPELRLDPEFDARFQREARIASQLADPHIVVVHDFGIDPTHGPFLVMEFLQGLSLRERLQSQGPLPFKAGLQMCGQLFLALIHAHGKGIVHRDIKPDNLFLLNQSGVRMHMRVLDFGIARILRHVEANQGQTLTHPGAVMGTPRYMSPEQLAGQPVDARSDIYSAALVIFEALTGQLPYTSGKQLSDLCPDVPESFQELISQCLKPNPDERPANAIEVYLRIQELGKASGILMLPPGAMDKLLAKRLADASTVTYVAPTAKSWPRRHLLLLVAVAAGLLFALVAISILLYVLLGSSSDNIGAIPAHESLAGIEIGDDRDTVMAKRGHSADEEQPHGTRGPLSPWLGDKAIKGFGHLLQLTDVANSDTNPGAIDVLLWSNDQVYVLLYENHVRAVVVHKRHAGASGRGVSVGDDVKMAFEDRYREKPDIRTFEIKPGDRNARLAAPFRGDVFASPAILPSGLPEWGQVRRYDALGIGFEIVKNRITAITLYPPKEH
jgi:tRNA A-37 threonylcarbamoyl transferase component Bud32